MTKRPRGNPNMIKGAPSVNPTGAAKAKLKPATGSDGVMSYGGFVQESGEGSSKLMGREKWVTYANAYSHPAVAISLLLRSALLSGVKWSLKENPAGGKNAKRGVEIVEQGLFKARLRKPWPGIVRRACNGRYFNGFSLHAAALARRKDGMVVFTDIDERPPHTIEKWFRPDPQAEWEAVEQRVDGAAQTYKIPLNECLYLVNDTVGNAPMGTGVLRFVVERLRRIEKYEALEGSELFSGMGGTPIARVPLEDLYAVAPGGTEVEKKAWVTQATQAITDAVRNRIKSPERQMWLELDSRTYQGSDPNTISNVQKWGIEVVKGELQGLEQIRGVIDKNDLHVARILDVVFVFVGGNDSAGTFGMHDSKVALFVASLQSDLDVFAASTDQQLIRRLIAANGIDPDTAAPTCVPSPILPEDVEKQARILGLINLAGLPANHPAKIAMYENAKIPWQDEDETEQLAPRVPPAKQNDNGDNIANIEPDKEPVDE